ncbi:YIP1 family protein [Thetidibacter halocola]|uniref:YIP1 family protein n=1 Tax=Thetidibacter halocola TaxID=2827239 RepID=A0A8J7WAE9_9RHOB|nr:YIP1 family protein [Thetidibacter halocola]
MTLQGFLSLAVQSVTAPRQVARLLLSIDLSREALRTAFALVIVLNAIVYALSQILSGGAVPVLLASPVVFMVLQGATLAGTIAAIAAIGRGLGGAGRIEDIALMMIWLQALRLLAQLAILLVLPLSPALGSALVGLATVLGIWIAAHFIDEAHGFDNMWRAILTLVLGVLAVIVALSFLLTLAGVDPNQVTGYV